MRRNTLNLGEILLLILLPGTALGAVRPLSPDTVQGAIQKGQAAKTTKDLCPFFDGVRTKLSSRQGLRGFSIFVRTPICDVAYQAFEAISPRMPPRDGCSSAPLRTCR